MISTPFLPPKRGYVEVENPEGRTYMNVSTGVLIENEDHLKDFPSDVDILKEQLSSTDYKVIKMFEYQVNGLDSPYDPVEIHAERQSIRDKINELEEK